MYELTRTHRDRNLHAAVAVIIVGQELFTNYESWDINTSGVPLTLLSRISFVEFPDVLATTSNCRGSSDSSVIAYRLRPGKEKKYSETTGKSTPENRTGSSSENENVIVILKKLEGPFNIFAQHSDRGI